MDSRRLADSVVQIDSTPMRSGQTRRRSQIIADPVAEEASRDQELESWRPTEPHVVQVEQMARSQWDVYVSSPKPDVHHFVRHEAVSAYLRSRIRTAMMALEPRPSPADIAYECEQLAERVLTIAANFRVANLDLLELRTWDIVPEMVAAEGNLKHRRGFLR